MIADLEALDWPPNLDPATAARLYDEMAAEWKAETQSGWVRSVHEAAPEPTERPPNEALEKVAAILSAEEARWWVGAADLQQHWLQRAHETFARWRAEDSAALDRALKHATSATVSFEESLASLPPTPRPGWAGLCAALKGEAAGAAAALEAARRELLPGASEQGAAAVDGTVDGPRLWRVLEAVRRAGAAAALPQRCDEMLRALRGGPAEGEGEGGGAAPSAASAVCLLLLLASGPQGGGGSGEAGGGGEAGGASGPSLTPPQRLDALLPWLCPGSGGGCGESGSGGGGGSRGGPSGGGGQALTLSQQRALFTSLFAAATAADAAARRLAAPHRDRGPSSCSGAGAGAAAAAAPPVAAPVGEALRRALDLRPHTWGLTPPTARDFLVWCAACEPAIAAALADTCDGEAKLQPAWSSEAGS